MKRYIRSVVNLDVDLDGIDYRLLLDLAGDSADPGLLRAILAKEPDNDYIKALIVANPRAPEDLVLTLMKEGHPKDPDERWDLARTTTNPKILTILANDSEVDTRQQVLTNDYTPLDDVICLLNDGTPYAKYAFNYAAGHWRNELPNEELIKFYRSDKINDDCKWLIRNTLFKRGLEV